MTNLDKAVATQLANIEKRTGRSLAELTGIVRASGSSRHGELVAMLKSTLGMGHGDANLVVQTVRKSDSAGNAPPGPASAALALDQLYAGPKAKLRPIHERLLARMREFGSFDEAPKKTYMSYRRRKQFAMIGPATMTQVEVGINAKGLTPSDRLVELPPKQMCDYKVRISDLGEIDDELAAWIEKAYDAAG